MAADQQFCLRWNNHQSTLISVFDTLLENGTLVDCTLAAEGQYLKAHKVVLSACSPYMETLLSQNYDKHPILILKDVKFTELKSMMDYMYRGEVNISQDQLGTFLKAAESLQIKGLSENGEGDARDVGSTNTNPPPPRRPPATRPEPEAAQSPAHRSRDGSVSPSSRKRRRLRRNSDDGDNHIESNSCDVPAQSTPVPNIPASITTTPIRTPIVKPEVNDRLDHNTLPAESGLLKEKIEPAEPLLEPKTEYLEDLNNDDSVEDLTLDDDDEMDMSQMSNLSNMSRPGPSHGADLSNQGFPPWQLGNQSGTDEVFMAAQEAVNAHRDSQDFDTMSGDDSGQGSSTSGGTANDSGVGSTAGDGNQSNSTGQGNEERKDDPPPPEQGPSGSSGSGGDDQDPSKNPGKNEENHGNEEEEDVEEDENINNEDSTAVDGKDMEDEEEEEGDNSKSGEETEKVQNGNDEASPADPSGKDFEPVTPTGVVPTHSGRGRPPGGGRGGRGGRGRGRGRGRGSRGGRGRGARASTVARPTKDPSRVYKKRERKAYKPSEMVRREFIKSPDVYQPIFQMSARRGRGSRGGRGGRGRGGRGRGGRGRPKREDMDKQEDSSSTSWDKDISDTLKDVINNAYKAKKFKAVGKKKKAFEDDSEDENLKHVKLGMMAYPVIQINKKSDNDIDAEAKYTFSGYCCNDCGAVYQSTAALRRHQTFECGKEPQFKCEQCDYAAKHKGTLKSHIKNRHLPRDGGDSAEKKPRKPRTPSLFRAPSPI